MNQRDPVNLDTQPSADSLRSTRETLEQAGVPDDANITMRPKSDDTSLAPDEAASTNDTNTIDMLQSPAAPIRERALSDSPHNEPFGDTPQHDTNQGQ